jgi:hypothetical protein
MVENISSFSDLEPYFMLTFHDPAGRVPVITTLRFQGMGTLDDDKKKILIFRELKKEINSEEDNNFMLEMHEVNNLILDKRKLLQQLSLCLMGYELHI